MHGTGKEAAEHNPQVSRHAKLGAHDGAENGPRASNVEKLYHENLPRGHGDVVHTVGVGLGRREARRIGTEHAFHKAAVNKIARHEGHKRK